LTPRELLAEAQGLLDRPDAATEGLWARSAALLIRQALEAAMADVLVERVPGAQAASFAAQLVVLPEVLSDRHLGHRVGWAWAALTEACHADDMRLPPTAEELRGWGVAAADLAALTNP
jgi:hypothetical protein